MPIHSSDFSNPRQEPCRLINSQNPFKLTDHRLSNEILFCRNSEQPSNTAVELGHTTQQLSHLQRTMEYQRLVELKRALRFGVIEPGGNHTEPFRFILPSGASVPSESPGLEGFIFTERMVVRDFGERQSAVLLPYYLHHVDALFSSLTGTFKMRGALRQIEQSDAPQLERYRAFIGVVRGYVDELRADVRRLDRARWSHSSRTYHIFARAFNLAGLREIARGERLEITGRIFADMSLSDIQHLRTGSIDTLRWMGIYPIGERGAKGTAGGSPFSVRRYEVAPLHGTNEEVQKLIRASASLGLRHMFELVLNHTAIDADLAESHPTLFVHTRTKPDDSTGYYHLKSDIHGDIWIRNGGWKNLDTGTREYWTDTLQLDFSNPDTRDLVIAQVKDLIKSYGVQSFRIDSAYQLLNRYFIANWREEMQFPFPEREFLDRLLTEVKTEYPTVAFVAEAFDGWDELSECGFDLIYGINDMIRRGGHRHHGWHDALVSRDSERIRHALRRAEFLHWQEGGADMLCFFGQHDKTAPWNEFGEWKWGAAALTLMKPGALSIYAGAEAEFEAPCKEDRKMITFNEPVVIRWDGLRSEFASFLRSLSEIYANFRNRLGELQFEALEPDMAGESWVGYVVRSSTNLTGEKILVLANPANHPTSVTIRRQDLGIELLEVEIDSCGEKGVELIYLPGLHRSSPDIDAH